MKFVELAKASIQKSIDLSKRYFGALENDCFKGIIPFDVVFPSNPDHVKYVLSNLLF